VVNAVITTDNSQSSYGQPVIQLEVEKVCLDYTSWMLFEYGVLQATDAEIELLDRWLEAGKRFAVLWGELL
jgi:hypothetical protein